MSTIELQKLITSLRAKWNIGQDFVAACDHVYSCRCEKCLQWWATIGPDDGGDYGPFSLDEIAAFLERETSRAPVSPPDISPALKPCPFCAARDQVKLDSWTVRENTNSPHTEWAVTCGNCGACGPNDVGASGAREMWNLRRETFPVQVGG